MRDHGGVILDRETDEPPPLTRGRQFTLRQVMMAVALIAVILAIAMQGPGWLALLAVAFVLAVLAACVYGISRLPYRTRLAIELATAGSLLILAAWLWRPPFYIRQAERTDEMVRLCRMLAESADDRPSRESFHRAADEYARRARMLRLQAMWYGLIRSATKEDPVPMGEKELILELGLLEARDRYEDLARKIGSTSIGRPAAGSP